MTQPVAEPKPFFFPPPVDIDRQSMQESVAAISAELALQPDLVPIRAQATNTAIQLQQQQQNQNAGSGGLNKLLTFSGSLSTTDWTTTDGVLRVDGNQLTMNPNVANGCYLVRANYLFATDDESVVAQLGTEATTDVYTYLCLRTNNTGTQGLACRVSANNIAIGTFAFTGSGGDAAFVTAASVGRGQATGDSVEFRAVGNAFVVLVNGNSVCTYSGALGNKGSSWRGASVIKQRAQPFFVTYSFNLYSFGMYDFGSVGASVTDRTAAKISRSSTASVGLGVGSGAQSLLPSNFFGIADFAQGMTITDIESGSIRADQAGWYEITASFPAKYTGGAGDFWGQMQWCLYVNGAVASHAIPAGVPLKRALAAGDVVQCGVVNVMSAVYRYTAGNADTAYGATAPSSLNAIGGTAGNFFQIVRES